ncbi:MAG: hypothetical protein ACRC4V_02435, partial [Aeromonas veronii]
MIGISEEYRERELTWSWVNRGAREKLGRGKFQIQKNQRELVCLVLLLMVRKERLELSRLGRQNLNLVRLPISPLP